MSKISSGTGEGMLEFLDYAGKKGLMNPATARAYRSATSKVLAAEPAIAP